MDNLQITAQRIKALCDKRNISINKMLQACNAGARTYHNILSGSNPSSDKILKIADYFEVSTDYLLGKTDNPITPTKEQKDEFSAVFNSLTHAEQEKVKEYIDFVISQRDKG